MPQESGLFAAAHHYDFGYSARTFDELAHVISKGPMEWSRKRESIMEFYTPQYGGDLIERIQPVDVGA
jgi:hypothetical protein